MTDQDFNIIIDPFPFTENRVGACTIPFENLIILYMPKDHIEPDGTVEMAHIKRRTFKKRTVFATVIRMLRWETFMLSLFKVVGYEVALSLDTLKRADPEFSDMFDEFGFGL